MCILQFHYSFRLCRQNRTRFKHLKKMSANLARRLSHRQITRIRSQFRQKPRNPKQPSSSQGAEDKGLFLIISDAASRTLSSFTRTSQFIRLPVCQISRLTYLDRRLVYGSIGLCIY